MHHVSKIDPASALTPHLYRAHSSGFRRATYVDRGMGSVHMGVGVCFLDPNGVIQPHLHSFEESFYILEGAVTLETGGKIHELGPGHFGLIPTGARHSWRNSGSGVARWLEMQAPQPRPADYGRDTFFGEEGAKAAEAATGYFDE
jgi:quercetin dioxygenase-like cupin family protein